MKDNYTIEYTINDVVFTKENVLSMRKDLIDSINLVEILESKLRMADNIIWTLIDNSEDSDNSNMHECHYCKEKSWSEIEHKKHCIIPIAEEFYYKENK